MTQLNESIKKEINDMCLSLDKSKDLLNKKFKSIMEEFVNTSIDNFFYYLETDLEYGVDQWIRQTCDDIIVGLLSGDTKWLKHQNIISEYDWPKIDSVRQAIWKSAGGEIANSTIAALNKRVEQLEKDIKFYREMRSY